MSNLQSQAVPWKIFKVHRMLLVLRKKTFSNRGPAGASSWQRGVQEGRWFIIFPAIGNGRIIVALKPWWSVFLGWWTAIFLPECWLWVEKLLGEVEPWMDCAKLASKRNAVDVMSAGFMQVIIDVESCGGICSPNFVQQIYIGNCVKTGTHVMGWGTNVL